MTTAIDPTVKQCRGPRCTAKIVFLLTRRGRNTPVDANAVAIEYARRGLVYNPHDHRLVQHWRTCIDRDALMADTTGQAPAGPIVFHGPKAEPSFDEPVRRKERK